MKIYSEKLNKKDFAPYGYVIEASGDFISANNGTSKRFNQLSELINNRSDAKPNVCLFRCQPREINPSFNVKILERHYFSTQLFSPLNAKKYLVVVCLNDPNTDRPDLKTLKAFMASGTQAHSYHPGIWHHPLIAVEGEIDFVCMVFENGSKGDTLVVDIDPNVLVYNKTNSNL